MLRHSLQVWRVHRHAERVVSPVVSEAIRCFITKSSRRSKSIKARSVLHAAVTHAGGGPSTSGRTAEHSAAAVPLATEGEDTIASMVTGGSRSGAVDIIRVSGSEAVQVAQRVFWPQGRFRFSWRPQSQRIYFGTAVDGEGRVVDEVLLLAMLTPRSYTREDVIELHTHGGGVCAQRVLRACIEAGARPARPGEFTLRAFLNGRMDLSQAENVLQLVNARTSTAADSALAGLAGGLGQLVSELRGDLLEILAELEARLDFDDDLPPMDVPALVEDITVLQRDIEAALRTSRQGNLLRQGLQVAIVGRPNVGKSSLMNSWTGTSRAIVTDIAGTTRDVLEAGGMAYSAAAATCAHCGSAQSAGRLLGALQCGLRQPKLLPCQF
eukprot:GHRQ01010784.1.p1 GENE.GHRQ01010784.1~~GHRQ01010784.1.p1  ORF type:complete len:382 (+),score=102.43 GHRQ01010784.1:62-1207(+)